MKNTSEAKPTQKRKGPIRTEAVLPTLLLFGLLFTYFHFLFDSHVRRGIEWVGTQANGAEVNVADVKTSFFRGTLEIRGIEVTDKDQPKNNLLQIGQIRFHVLWDGLLRAKAVVDDASVLQIALSVPRRKPGYVVPPTPPDGKPSLLEKTEKMVLNQAQEQYSKNMFGDLAAMLSGVDPKDQLNSVQGTLKSNTYIQQLTKDVEAKKKLWQERIEKLPKSKDLEGLKQRFQALKFDLKNPAEFARSTAEAQKIVKEADEKIKLVQTTGAELNSDIKLVDSSLREVDRLVREDMKDLEARFKIPSLDPKAFTQQIFMKWLEQKAGRFARYITLAESYVPAPTASTEKPKPSAEVIPPARGSGKTYQFPTTTYPLFWLKVAQISSNAGGLAGNMKGQLTNLTTDPGFVRRPTVLKLSGDFPTQGIFGFAAEGVMDHTTSEPKESLDVTVAKYKVVDQSLSDSPDFQLNLTSATARAKMNATYMRQVLDLRIDNQFSDAKFVAQIKDSTVNQILKDVLDGIPTVTLNARVSGSLDHLDFNMNSNLGEELSKGFKRQIQAKVDALKAQVQSVIDKNIKGQRAQLDQQVNGLKGGLTKEVDAHQADMTNFKKSLESKGGGGSGNNPLQDLKKRFGF